VSQTLGFGVEQFISGLSRIGFGDWLFSIDAETATAPPRPLASFLRWS
jgi:hypothetical protein